MLKFRSSRPRQAACSTRRSKTRSSVDDVFEVGEEAIDRVTDGGRSKLEQREPDDRVLEFSRDWTDAVDVLVVAVQERSEECWW